MRAGIDISGENNVFSFNVIEVAHGPGIRLTDAKGIALGWNTVVCPGAPFEVSRSKQIRIHDNLHGRDANIVRQAAPAHFARVAKQDEWPVLERSIPTREELGNELYEKLFGRAP